MHRSYRFRIIAAFKDGGACDEDVRTGIGDGTDVFQRDAAVDLQEDLRGNNADQLLLIKEIKSPDSFTRACAAQ